MKVPIGLTNCIDLDAPTLPARSHRTGTDMAERWAVWCAHCQIEHFHGVGDGHREAHCNDAASPYFVTGYNLVLKSTGD